MPNHFYKAVKHFHITGSELSGGVGIRFGGLDPHLRNTFGGATGQAALTINRGKSAADATGIGQCVTGSLRRAVDYADENAFDRILRITLPDVKLANLVVNSHSLEPFASMDDAMSATECTAITIIHPKYIEYLTRNPESRWAPIAGYQPKLAEDNFSTLSELELGDDW